MASIIGTAPSGIGSIVRRDSWKSRVPLPDGNGPRSSRAGNGSVMARLVLCRRPRGSAPGSPATAPAERAASVSAFPRRKPASGRERAIRLATEVLRITAATTMKPVSVRK